MGFMFLFMVLGVILIQRAACDSMSRCDLAKHTSCMAQLDENHRMLFRMDITELGLINSCNKLNDALACTNEVIVDGCPEEVKHFLPPVPAYFGLARDTLCGKGVGVGPNLCSTAGV